VIGEDPATFFDPSCIPSGFKFQDPSRMGITVKLLLTHLRTRQETLGVDAFQFHHVLRHNKLEPAEYPNSELRQEADAAPPLDGLPAVLLHEESLEPPTSSKKKRGVKKSATTPKNNSKISRKHDECPDEVSPKIHLNATTDNDVDRVLSNSKMDPTGTFPRNPFYHVHQLSRFP